MAKEFCNHCGRPLEIGDEFCPNCGAPSEHAERAHDNAQAPQQSSPKQSGGIKAAPIIIAVIVAALIVIIAIVVIAGGSGSSEDPKSQGSPSESSTASSSSSSSESAQPVTPTASAPVFESIQVSSVLPPDSNNSDYGPNSLVDGLVDTAWNEGSSGSGVGEWFMLSSSTPQYVTSVSIIGGYPKNKPSGADVYYMNNRPRDITIMYDGGSFNCTMADRRGAWQTFTLPKPVYTTFIAVTINSVYGGEKYNDCCVAEVKVS